MLLETLLAVVATFWLSGPPPLPIKEGAPAVEPATPDESAPAAPPAPAAEETEAATEPNLSSAGGGGSRAQHVSGQIVPNDHPSAAIETRPEGRVETRFMVGTDGRVSNCRVTRSSGNAALDQTTCRLIEQRFLWAPARDAQGNAIAEERSWHQN